ncbi:MAG: hypothetical protein ACRDWD_10980 [Acidimicrobiia bacterium]
MRCNLRTGLRALALAAVATGAVVAGAIPGDSQETAGFSATQVGGSAFGVQADVTRGFFDEGGAMLDVEGLLDATRNGDREAAEQILSDAGVDVNASAPQGAAVSASVGPVPTVTLPPEGGGPFTDSVPGVDLAVGPVSIEISGGIDVLTEGAIGRGGFSTSSSRVTSFNPGEFKTLLFAADLLETECSADIASGPRGSTRFTAGESLDGDIPDLPAPNTVLLDESKEVSSGGGSILIDLFLVANEQTLTPNSITVSGARGAALIELRDAQDNVIATISLNEVVSQSHCDIVLAPVVEPTFTG